MVTAKTLPALSFNHGQNSEKGNALLMKLNWGGAGGITMLPLLTVESNLFASIGEEVAKILQQPGQELDGSHPTTVYVGKQDSSWKPKTGSVKQYSLYNCADDFLYNEGDHRWVTDGRRFNSSLTHIPRLFELYFPSAEIQNCRLNSLTKDGGLGQHREKIIGIPGREHDYKLRFHLPVITNPDVIFYMDGQPHRMEAGKIYLFNQSCMHGVNNAGEALRAHIVWDLYLNDDVVDTIERAL